MLVLLIGFFWILTALTALTLGADIDDETTKRDAQAAKLAEMAEDAWIDAAPAPIQAPTVTLAKPPQDLSTRPRLSLVKVAPPAIQPAPTLSLDKSATPRKISAPWLPLPLKVVPVAPLSLALSHWHIEGSHTEPFQPERHKVTRGGMQKLKGKRWVFMSRADESKISSLLTI